MKKLRRIVIFLVMCVVLLGCQSPKKTTQPTITLDEIPTYSGKAYVEINGNVPEFSEEDKSQTKSFENYSQLDKWGRCGVAFANIGKDLMPTDKRGNIGQIKPSGWHTVKYDNVDGKYLYNRCHLIGFQLTGENANEKNLITGTRYMNVEGMLPFENMVADYVKETENHLLYRVTPIFEGDNLVANGVQMEAMSVEDKGKDIEFNVFVYNVQPGIHIDYLTGESYLEGETQKSVLGTFVIGNKNSKVYHNPDCKNLPAKKNQIKFNNASEAQKAGYRAASDCE